MEHLDRKLKTQLLFFYYLLLVLGCTCQSAGGPPQTQLTYLSAFHLLLCGLSRSILLLVPVKGGIKSSL